MRQTADRRQETCHGQMFIKPSEFTSASTLELADLFHEAGFPAGVVNVITGFGREARRPAGGPPAGAQDQLHRLRRHRPPDQRAGWAPVEARVAGAGRQGNQHRVRRSKRGSSFMWTMRWRSRQQRGAVAELGHQAGSFGRSAYRNSGGISKRQARLGTQVPKLAWCLTADKGE